MDASSSNPADRNSGADNNIPGDANKPQKERRAAKEAEDAELAQRMAEREAGVEEVREEWAIALRQRIERREEDLRELLAREAEMHSSRGTQAPASAPAIVPPATLGAGLTKRGRGRLPNLKKTPKVKTPRVPRKAKSVEPERTPSRGEEDDDEENDENDSDKEMTGDNRCDNCRENSLVCVVPPYSRKNRRACAWCHRKKIRCSLGNAKDTAKTETAKMSKHRPGKVEVDRADIVLPRTRGAVQRAAVYDLEAHCQEMEEHIEILNQRFGVTYWALVGVLKNFDNENAEAQKKLFNGILRTLARFEPARPDDAEDEPPRKQRRVENRRETSIGPESESETSADTHVKVWRKSVMGAETPEENEYIDMEMEDAAGKIGPEKVAEKTPEVGPAIHENVESAQEAEPITEQVPSVERTAGEITEVGASTEEIADTSPNAEETAKQAPTVEENVERTPPVVQIAETSIPEVTPKVEELPVQIADGPSGIAAGPGQMWVLMPVPDQVIKAEEDRVFLRVPVHVPTDGPGSRVNDPIILDSDDDNEMEVDPPAAEGEKDVEGAK
ncbi:hypothetical protein GGX14DRAFT_570596 [Mycena pura]|uniref:Zn(2)-C6 fungal-type domain-containing protein n=1 Tax=Mycena pura TaxID=153505 RepID=A0AAD6Y736_9AGAR|nr:hypothetical protein GGX14DRAFT_570596 [Mycena pura]